MIVQIFKLRYYRDVNSCFVRVYVCHPKQDLKRSNMAVKLRHGHHEVWTGLVFATFCLQVIIPFIVQVHWHPMALDKCTAIHEKI